MIKYLLIIVSIPLMWFLYLVATTTSNPTITPTPTLAPTAIISTTITPTPAPKITSWATLEYQWFIEANQKNWSWLGGWNEVGETRYYRKESGTWVRKNSQAEAEIPYHTPTPMPITTPTPRPCPPNSYLIGDSCTCLSRYIVNETKTACITDPQIAELNKFIAEWEQQQKELDELVKSYSTTPTPDPTETRLRELRTIILQEIQKISSNSNITKSMAQTRINNIGSLGNPIGLELYTLGIRAICNDMWFSTASDPQGDCSWHGGVLIWVR